MEKIHLLEDENLYRFSVNSIPQNVLLPGSENFGNNGFGLCPRKGTLCFDGASYSFPWSFVVSKSQVKWFHGVGAKLYYFSFDFLSHAIFLPNMELSACSKFFSRQ